ncbi:MAG TPA: GNAT family protein [Nitrolancea sp.]|nr:GNAT family protein [Nitrolancea sp.]
MVIEDDDALVTSLTGDRVALGPLRRELVPTFYRWKNTLSTSRTLGLSWPTTLEQEEGAYEQSLSATQRVDFVVYERATLRPIGTTYLYEIDYRHSRAGFGIIIGEETARGQGYGTEATRLTLDYAFTALGLNNVLLTVYEFNLAGIHAYRKAGFQEIGRRRRCSRLGQRLWDLIYMDCVADDFESPVLGEVFGADEGRGTGS